MFGCVFQVRHLIAVSHLSFSSTSPCRLATVEHGRDLAVYSAAPADAWQCLNRASLLPDLATDAAGVAFSPAGDRLAVWGSCLEFFVAVFTGGGHPLFRFSPVSHPGGLGVKTVSWAPCGRLLYVGSYDGKLRLVNVLGGGGEDADGGEGRVVATFVHENDVRKDNYLTRDCAVFEEKERRPTDVDGKIVQVQRNVLCTWYSQSI